jgi:hypothetical protein
MANNKSASAFGFYTVVGTLSQGLIGGYLVLNAAGRPLEFHCTAPVKPSRAQAILFGATLEPYLYGEYIGLTLVAKAETAVHVICTNLRAALAVRQHIDLPVALLGDDAMGAATTVAIANTQLGLADGFADDERAIVEHLSAFAARMPLAEPFDRIREAIAEAERSAA